MNDLLIRQLKFARSEFERVFAGVDPGEAQTRLLPNNSLSWIVGHLAWQEQRYWIWAPTGKLVFPELNTLTANGQPASTPDYAEMWYAWRAITAKADHFLASVAEADLPTHYEIDGKPFFESIGTLLQRTTFHYWFHIGEAHAIRQQLGHGSLPDFVGKMTPVEIRQEGWAD